MPTRSAPGAFPIAILSLVISILSAVFAFWNAKTNHDALTTVQRAFVFPIHFDTSVTLEGTNMLRGHNTPVWENSGNTPTKKLLVKGFCLETKEGVETPFGHPDSTAAAGGDRKLMIGPKGTINGPDCGLRSDLIDDIVAGGHHFYQWGYVTYDDVFYSSHRTEFCLEIVNPRLARIDNKVIFERDMVPCKKDNCADDDCPAAAELPKATVITPIPDKR